MSFLRSKQRSTNMEQRWVNDNFKPVAENLLAGGAEGLGNVRDFLTGADTTGFEQYRDSSGYQNIFNEAMRGVTSNAAARGLLSSGAMVRTAQDRAGQLAQQQYDNYLQRLMGVSQAQLAGGMNAGNVVANVGAQNERAGGLGGIVSAFKDIGSIGSSIGQFASVLSDIRAKEDIVLLEREPDGLGIYEFRYKGEPEVHVGVMAQEVERLRPHALGPLTEDGYMTVDYGKL